MMKPQAPLWMDTPTLCTNICASERTVDSWVAQGLLPPPRRVGGKRLWKWSEVDEYLTNGGVTRSPDAQADEIRNATRRAAAAPRY